jgi:hypothetical protein
VSDVRYWYWLRGTDRLGPVSEGQLVELLRSREVGPMPPILNSSRPEWTPAHSVVGAPPASPPPASSSPALSPTPVHLSPKPEDVGVIETLIPLPQRTHLRCFTTFGTRRQRLRRELRIDTKCRATSTYLTCNAVGGDS